MITDMIYPCLDNIEDRVAALVFPLFSVDTFSTVPLPASPIAYNLDMPHVNTLPLLDKAFLMHKTLL